MGSAASSSSYFTNTDTFNRLDGGHLRALSLADGLLRLECNRAAVSDGLQTTMVSTCADGTVFVNGQVADLTRRTGHAAVDLSVEEQACADPCPDLDIRQVPFASSSSGGSLAQRTQFCIVIK